MNFLLALLSPSFVFAQACDPNFELCVDNRGREFIASTCDLYRTSNVTMYTVCQCYSLTKQADCYKDCPAANQTIQSALSSLQTSIGATCGSVGIILLLLSASLYTKKYFRSKSCPITSKSSLGYICPTDFSNCYNPHRWFLCWYYICEKFWCNRNSVRNSVNSFLIIPGLHFLIINSASFFTFSIESNLRVKSSRSNKANKKKGVRLRWIQHAEGPRVALAHFYPRISRFLLLYKMKSISSKFPSKKRKSCYLHF